MTFPAVPQFPDSPWSLASAKFMPPVWVISFISRQRRQKIKATSWLCCTHIHHHIEHSPRGGVVYGSMGSIGRSGNGGYIRDPRSQIRGEVCVRRWGSGWRDRCVWLQWLGEWIIGTSRMKRALPSSLIQPNQAHKNCWYVDSFDKSRFLLETK